MTRSAALLLLAVLPLTACSGGSEKIVDAVPFASASPSSAAPSVAPSASPSPSASAGAPASASTSPAARPQVAAAPRSAAPSTAASPGSAKAASTVAPTRPGTYTYDSSGTVTAGGAPQSAKGTATLTVDPASGSTQSTVLEGDQGRTETDVVLRKDGRYVSRLLLTTPAFSKEFRPSPAVLLLPEPAAVGRTWTWTATSTDGKTRVTAKNRVLPGGSVVVGGKRLATRVVETTLALRGDLTYDGTTTTDEDPATHLAVRTRGKGRGTVSGVMFSNDTTSTLRSTDPR